MTFNRHWVIKEKEFPDPSHDAVKICPYFKKISSLASYSLDGQCLAWAGFMSRFCTIKDIREYCKEDYQECPLYKAAASGEAEEYQKDDMGAWPSL